VRKVSNTLNIRVVMVKVVCECVWHSLACKVKCAHFFVLLVISCPSLGAEIAIYFYDVTQRYDLRIDREVLRGDKD